VSTVNKGVASKLGAFKLKASSRVSTKCPFRNCKAKAVNTAFILSDKESRVTPNNFSKSLFKLSGVSPTLAAAASVTNLPDISGPHLPYISGPLGLTRDSLAQG